MIIKDIIKNFVGYSGLLTQLVAKDLKRKYKQSFLGYIWSILNPLLTMTVLYLVFSNVFGRNVDNFAIYLLTGQLMFNAMSEGTRAALNSITGNASLLQKVYIPKYMLTLSSVISALISQLFSLCALIIVMLTTQFVPPVTALLFFVPILYQFIFCIGLGMILATFMVFFRDTSYIYGIFMTLWMYMTPIFYSFDILPQNVAAVIKVVNPMYHYLAYMRDIILYGRLPAIAQNLQCLIYSLLFLVIGAILFYKKQNRFVLFL